MLKHISFLLLLLGTPAFAEDILANGLYKGHFIVSHYAEEISGLRKIEYLASSEKDSNLSIYYNYLQEQTKDLEKARATAACQVAKGTDVKTFTTTLVYVEHPILVWDFGYHIPNPLVKATSYYPDELSTRGAFSWLLKPKKSSESQKVLEESGSPLGLFTTIECEDPINLASNSDGQTALAHRTKLAHERKTHPVHRAGFQIAIDR